MSGGGWVWVLGSCLCCGQYFDFNPHKVPSHPWPPPDGPRTPICASCIEIINVRRVEAGLEPWPVAPDAYQPIEEGAL
jgi:hypothetical protein